MTSVVIVEMLLHHWLQQLFFSSCQPAQLDFRFVFRRWFNGLVAKIQDGLALTSRQQEINGQQTCQLIGVCYRGFTERIKWQSRVLLLRLPKIERCIDAQLNAIYDLLDRGFDSAWILLSSPSNGRYHPQRFQSMGSLTTSIFFGAG